MRRKALILLACVVALIGLAGCAQTTKEVKGGGATTLQILHLSDLHIGKSHTIERDNLIDIVDKIKKKWGGEANKPVVLITGDISNGAEERQFKKAKTILLGLKEARFEVLLVPGNHDYGPSGSYVVGSNFELFRTQLSEFFPEGNVTYPFTRRLNGHVVIGLDSMQGHAHGIEKLTDKIWADGDLGDKQVEITAATLDSLENRDRQKQKVIVYLHHHPFLYPDEKRAKKIGEMFGHWLDDGEKFMRKISNRVDILLFGHEHRHLDLSDTEISTKYGIPIILSAGMSTDNKMIEYEVDREGKADKDKVLNKGLLGRLIRIQDDGTVKVETVKF